MGSAILAEEDSTIVTTPDVACGAKVGETCYETLYKAFGEAPTGSLIVLQENVVVSSDATRLQILVDKEITLDLNGKSITTENYIKSPINISEATLTIKDSGDTGVVKGFETAVSVFRNSTFTLESGTLDGIWYGVAGNGGNQNGTTINIKGGTIKNNDPDKTGAAIYHPQEGTINISGGTIIGDTGIQLCSGKISTISISGGKIVGTGNDLRADKKGDGAVPDGAAISLVNRPGYQGIPVAEITGGNFISEKTEAVLAYIWSDNKATDWATAKDYLKISGGTFSHDVKNYVISGFGSYSVEGAYKVMQKTQSISLSDTALTLKKTSTGNLTATKNPENSLDPITWTSSDEKIATVDSSGVVTALAAGKATITAKAADATATCVVTVESNVVIDAVEDIKNTVVTKDNAQELIDDINQVIKDSETNNIILDESQVKVLEGKKVDSITALVPEVAVSVSAPSSGDLLSVNKLALNILNLDDVLAAKADGMTSFDLKLTAVAKNSDADKNNIMDKINSHHDLKYGNFKVLSVMDLSVLIETSNGTDSKTKNLTELSSPISLLFSKPSTPVDAGKKLVLLRLHDGKIEEIPYTLDKDGHVMVDSDKYSDYAFAIRDEKIVKPTPPTGGDDNDDGYEVPNTADKN